jgi:L-threonylcarbamoyladenylate synthase
MRTVAPGEAIAALKAGKVALVPTETVVGLVATEPGLQRIREIKGREANKPIALLCASAEEAFGLAANVPPLAEQLADIYWPGPLTLVLDLPSGGTIGVRVPAGRAVRGLLESYGGPLYATSANISGEPAPAALDEVDPRVLEAVEPRRSSTSQEATCGSSVGPASCPHRSWPGSLPNEARQPPKAVLQRYCPAANLAFKYKLSAKSENNQVKS